MLRTAGGPGLWIVVCWSLVALIACSSDGAGTGVVKGDGRGNVPKATLDAEAKRGDASEDAPVGGPTDGAACGLGAKANAGEACGCDQDCRAVACVLGVCCSGEGCAKRPLGAACQGATDCASGLCADGVCCNLACDGACVACNLPSSPGECTAVTPGERDPHGKCRVDGEKSCGQNGLCNGFGGCAKYPAKTVCEQATCKSDHELTPAGQCDGAGTCVVGTTIMCDPNQCAAGACRTTCEESASCVGGAKCDPITKSCGKRGNGQLCDASTECLSGFCADGVCCDKKCDGTCSYCAYPNNLGTCVAVAANAVDPRTFCKDEGANKCSTNGKCDGKGACQRYANDTPCGSASCNAGANEETPVGTCENGSCKQTKRSCSPFQGCSGSSCLRSCSGDSDLCVAPNVCRDNNSCGAGASIGAQCSRDDECGSRICSQGRCCETRCDGVCKSCNVAGQAGKCVNVGSGGADPQGRCSGVCFDGCDGSGACKRAPTGAICKAAVCSGDTAVAVSRCSGSGVCEAKTEVCDAGQICKNNTCAHKDGAEGDLCVVKEDCRVGLICRPGGTCGPPLSNGSTCTNDSQCSSAQCVTVPGGAGRVCCNKASCGACESCATGVCKTTCPEGSACSMNVCTTMPAGGLGDACGATSPCGPGLTCTNALCKRADAQACADAAECASGHCLGRTASSRICCASACPECGECSTGTCKPDEAKQGKKCGGDDKAAICVDLTCAVPGTIGPVMPAPI